MIYRGSQSACQVKSPLLCLIGAIRLRCNALASGHVIDYQLPRVQQIKSPYPYRIRAYICSQMLSNGVCGVNMTLKSSYIKVFCLGTLTYPWILGWDLAVLLLRPTLSGVCTDSSLCRRKTKQEGRKANSVTGH